MRTEPGPRQAVLIMTDTQGANCVDCYRTARGLAPGLHTPQIDRLASEGVRFDAAYTTSPVCTPARGALFTGCFPHTNGAWGNELALGKRIRTLGERVTDGGIRAAYTGKWHLSATDYFDTGTAPPGWEPAYWFDGRNHLESLPGALRSFSREYHTAEELREAGYDRDRTFAGGVTDRAVRFLEDAAEEDFLLVVSYDEPHHPSIAPPPFAGLFAEHVFDTGPARTDGLEGKPALQRAWAERSAGHETRTGDGRYRCPAYFDCNAFVDDEIGKVLAAVRRHAPDALVIYTSDHGEMMHAHGLHGKGPAMYEEITHIPLLVRWPGVVPAGATCAAPISHIDLTPTLLDYFGLPVPGVLEGRNLLGHWRDVNAMPSETIFMEFGRFSVASDNTGGLLPIRCAFDGRWKLALNLFDRDELYDLERDPAEMVNRIDDPSCAEVRDRLHLELLWWMRRTRDPFRGRAWEFRAWCPEGRGMPPEGRMYWPEDGYLPPPLSYGTGMPVE